MDFSTQGVSEKEKFWKLERGQTKSNNYLSLGSLVVKAPQLTPFKNEQKYEAPVVLALGKEGGGVGLGGSVCRCPHSTQISFFK